MSDTLFNRPETRDCFEARESKIARIGIPREAKSGWGKTYNYCDWVAESEAFNELYTNKDIINRFHRKAILCDMDTDSHFIELRLGSEEGRIASLDDVLMVILRYASSRCWEYNLDSMQNIAELIYMSLTYSWEDIEANNEI